MFRKYKFLHDFRTLNPEEVKPLGTYFLIAYTIKIQLTRLHWNQYPGTQVAVKSSYLTGDIDFYQAKSEYLTRVLISGRRYTNVVIRYRK